MAQLNSQVIGHRKLFDQWTQLLKRGQITGSFLFVGPNGVGKKKSAWAFIQETLCESSRIRPCGECGSCRRVEIHQHESVLFVEPDGAQIKVEQAQDILRFLQLRSLSRQRFILIDEAHKLNPAAANSLLKTLEEPAEGDTLILLAPSLTSILPTIRSRLRVFHFQPVPIEEMRAAKTAPEWALEASLGRFDILEALSTSDEREFRNHWSQFFIQFLTSPDTLTEETWRDALKNKEDLKHALDLWLKMVRDALFLQQGEKKSLLTLDLGGALQKLSKFSSIQLQTIAQGLIQLQKEMNFNKEAVLSLESLYIHLKG